MKLPSRPDISLVIAAYNMARELPRTLRSLMPSYQRGMDGLFCEIIVIDNGSPVAFEPDVFDEPLLKLHVVRLTPVSYTHLTLPTTPYV